MSFLPLTEETERLFCQGSEIHSSLPPLFSQEKEKSRLVGELMASTGTGVPNSWQKELIKSELLLWQSVGVEWRGRRVATSMMVEESLSGGLIGVAIVRIRNQIAFPFTQISVPPFILFYPCVTVNFGSVLRLLSSLFQSRLSSHPPFSLNLITLLYANYNSFRPSLLCIPLSLLQPNY